jgi:lantibiotic modifying enzyme
VAAKVASLSEQDLALQLELLRMSLHASGGRGAGAPYAATSFASEADDTLDSSPATFRELALEEASAVSSRLRTHGIFVGDEVTWFGVGYLPRTRRHVAGPMAYTLAEGYCGVGLFLAAHARIAQSDEERAFALAAIRALRTQLEQIRHYTAVRKQIDTGIANGLGSAIYAFTRIARLIDEPVLLDEAAFIARALTPDVIGSDEAYDVSAGTAGALLALLAHYQATGDASSLAAAVCCGDHLLARSCTSAHGDGLTWPTAGTTCDVGFAHGALGIGTALARLARATGVSGYADAARQAIAHDCRLVSVSDRCDWVEGVVGVGFAQLEIEGAADESALDHALTRARQQLTCGPDGLASGALGRADVLLCAGQRRGDDALIEAARAGARRIVAGARRRNHYRTGWGDDFDHLGLFHGLPGIAYQLLRLAAPDELPSVLTWQ